MIRRIRNGLLMGVAVFLLSACSKTVTWEEEVPLNTGEVIWVKRSMPWTYMGGFGNPFDIAMRPTREQTIRFAYGGINYSFTKRVQVGWLAISPNGKPVLVAIPGSFGWNYLSENTYYCVTPYYVQFSPDQSGAEWKWPEKIDTWLYTLPANLMISMPQPSDGHLNRYTKADRDRRDAAYRLQSPHAAKIDPMYHADGDCPKRNQ